jgi:arylsulfatase A-like enzyme
MGYWTPNIDRIGKEGAMFTCWYGQQSCTAGRAAFITGQSPIRTGLTKVGLPGADVGLHAEDPTIAEILKNLGYATGQFGKNHLGDKDEFLPSNHGFDEFFGNLTTSMQKRSRKISTIRKTLNSERGSAHAACSKRPQMARLKTPAR